MAQTKEGALKTAAKRASISVEGYKENVARGLKWCIGCRRWHGVNQFGKDASRHDGLVPTCRDFKNGNARKMYQPKPPPEKGRSFVPARDGDQNQAKRRINYFVESGLIPRPNDLPCTDCGHVWGPGEKRHEYDHYLGYAAEHHETVQVVCTSCHRKREWDGGRRCRQRSSG